MAPFELPIFPLPLVLFPGASQLLHIFEARYRQMLADCMKRDHRFGISWVDTKGSEDPAPEAGTVGCIAEVRSSTPLPDGKANILTVGEERYVLLAYAPSQAPYRVARVEPFADDPEAEPDTRELSARVVESFRRFSTALNALTDSPASFPKLSGDATSISFQVSAALEIEGRVKQELLTMRSSRQRLEALERLLRSVTADLGPRAEVHVRARKNGKGGTNAAIVRDP